MQTSRGNIVIVEDDAGLNRAIARLLQTAGFDATSFNNAEALLESATKDVADCFVVDIHLPGISGLELRTRLTVAGVLRPFVFMTARDDPKTREFFGGADGCIRKPFTRDALIQAIEAALMAADSP
jgi:FixJ family two-component response regulator